MDYEALEPLVKKVARDIHRSYPGHLEVEDTEQELWVFAMESEATITKIMNESKVEAEFSKPLLNLFIKYGTKVVRQQDAASHKFDPEDVFHYSQGLIKSILEVIFDYEDWQSFSTAVGKPRGGKPSPSSIGNNIASYADVKSAVENLPDDQYNAVVWRYKYHYTYEMLGEELGLTRQGAQRRLEAAVGAVQRLLGRKPPSELRKPPQRLSRPRSAEAQAIIEQQY